MPIAWTLAALHFVEQIQSKVAFNTTTFLKKKNTSFKPFHDYHIFQVQ